MRLQIEKRRTSWIVGICIALGAAALLWGLYGVRRRGVLFGGAFLLVNVLRIEIKNQRLRYAMLPGLALMSSVLCFLLVQFCLGLMPQFEKMGRVGNLLYVLNVLCYLALIVAIYALSGDMRWAVAATLVIFLVLATANFYTVEFRGTEIKPSDLLSVGTALNVVGGYQLEPKSHIVYSWLVALLWIMGLLRGLRFEKPSHRSMWSRLSAICVLAVCLIVLRTNAQHVLRTQWQMEGSLFNGFAVNFTMQEIRLQKPEGYDQFDVSGLEGEYGTEKDIDKRPHIIVIMDEAFSDLRLYSGTLPTDREVMPFFDSIQDNAVKGFALASIVGGGTANSEYELLTGNTMAFLPEGAMGYQQYVKQDTYSLVDYMNSLGYRSVAMHPFHSNGWMRATAWPALGFEQSLFLEDFPKEDLLRGYVTDREMFSCILELLDQDAADSPLFLFGVTMQNHGGYMLDWEDTIAPIHLEGLSREYPETEHYLALVRESDSALQYFMEELAARDEDVVLLFYGDHQPGLEQGLIEELYGGKLESQRAAQLRYTIPFVLWANYDITEEQGVLTSLNYLGGTLLETAGLPLPPYSQFLRDLETYIPAMNTLGYYSGDRQAFVDYTEAQGREKAMLDAYQALEYNSIKGGKHRSQVFFPVH